jgi:hypothetical protein
MNTGRLLATAAEPKLVKWIRENCNLAELPWMHVTPINSDGIIHEKQLLFNTTYEVIKHGSSTYPQNFLTGLAESWLRVEEGNLNHYGNDIFKKSIYDLRELVNAMNDLVSLIESAQVHRQEDGGGDSKNPIDYSCHYIQALTYHIRNVKEAMQTSIKATLNIEITSLLRYIRAWNRDFYMTYLPRICTINFKIIEQHFKAEENKPMINLC